MNHGLFGKPAVTAVLSVTAASGLGVLAWVYQSRQGGATFTETVTYDSLGHPSVRRTGNGKEIHYRYDAAGRLSRLLYPGHEVLFDYDGNGNLVAALDDVGRIELAYDPLDRLKELRSVNGQTIEYEYDPWGRTLSVTPSGGHRVEYERDVVGRIVAVHDGFGLTTFDYSPGRVERRLPNGFRTIYDVRSGELDALRHVTPGGEPLVEYIYTRDEAKRIVAIDERTPSATHRIEYLYDEQGRVISTQEDNNPPKRLFYDPMGNRLREDEGMNSVAYRFRQGLMIERGPDTFAYDEAGNQVAKRGSQATDYEFDGVGRLAAVNLSRDRIRYQYDALDQRVMRDVNGRKRYFLHDVSSGRPEVAAEYDSDGRMERQYLLANGRIGERDAAGRIRYYLEDHLGSIRYVVNETGQVENEIDYSTFGVPRRESGSGFRFAGEEWDEEAGLIFLRNRYFDPQSGRFLSRDPFPGQLDQSQSFNRYIYAFNDPVNLVDPTGLAPEDASHPPVSTQGLQDWWRDWAAGVLANHPNRAAGYAAAAVASFEYAVLEKYIAPIETGIRQLADPVYVQEHPIGRFGTGIKLSFDVFGLVPLRTAPSSLKISFSSKVAAAERIQVLRTGTRPAETRTYLPFGLDKAYPGSKSLRFSLDQAGRLFDAGQESLSLGRELAGNPAIRALGDQAKRAVGGVRLDQTADWQDNIGSIVGAVYDPESGRLMLVGERNALLPPMRQNDLASALQAVTAGGDVSMTIDPDPKDPYGPVMNVQYFNTEDTHLGMVMFEADRILKGITVGRDNLTQEPVKLNIPGFQNIAELGVGLNRKKSRGLWIRFWLVPDRVSLRTTPDGRSVLFGETRMRIRTETMRWKDGRLVSAGGEKDPNAERIATMLTEHYSELERQFPVFGELKRLAEVVALARWMKESGIPVDPRWVEQAAGAPFKTPDTTPSATNLLSRETGSVTYQVSVFGGVQLDSQTEYRFDRSVKTFRKSVVIAMRQGKGDSFDLPGQPGRRAFAVPSTDTRMTGSWRTSQSDLPGLVRFYDSWHRDWKVLLPHLYVESEGRQVISIPGERREPIRKKTYLLTDAFGLSNERFEEPFVDAEFQRIGYRSPSSAYRGLYPDGEGRSVLLSGDGAVWQFDAEGQAIMLTLDGETVRFTYSGSGLLQSITTEEDSIQLHYANGRLRIAVGANGSIVEYTYDADGNLVLVKGPAGETRYEYSRDGHLTSMIQDGEVCLRVAYDHDGRWTRQIDSRDRVISEQRYEKLKTVTRDRAGVETASIYNRDGSLQSVHVKNPDTTQWSAEWSSDRRRLTTVDGRGTRKEFQFDALGRIQRSLVNGDEFVAYSYDASGLRMLANYPGFQATLQPDEVGTGWIYGILQARTWQRPANTHPQRSVLVPAFAGTRNGDSELLGSELEVPHSTDEEGNVTRVSLPDGGHVDYSYDSDGRVSRVAEWMQ